MGSRIDLPVAQMARRYEAGESTYQLGRAYGVCGETVRKRLWGAGVAMRPPHAPLGNKYGLGNKSRRGQHGRGGPLSTNHGYLNTYDREGRQCGVHRGCWEAHHGAVPNGFVVHHDDEDRLNNAIENLACMTNAEHLRLHAVKDTR